MNARANYFELAPKAIQILMAQEEYLSTQFTESETITKTIWELVKLRVSQINQCAFCIDMHSRDLLDIGETFERIVGVSAWRDMPMYSDTERAALDWGEHVTSGQAVDDSRYSDISGILGERDLVNLTVAINAINSWNRIAKTFKPEVGSYKK